MILLLLLLPPHSMSMLLCPRYYSSAGSLLSPPGDWGSAYREQAVVQHNTVVKAANSRGLVVTRLHPKHAHLTPDVHR